MATKKNKMWPARQALYFVVAFFNVAQAVYARETFNPELVELDNPGMGKADLSAFETGGQAPGLYRVDIILDDQLVETKDVQFIAGEEADAPLQPCLSLERLKAWGVKTALFPALSQDSADCVNLASIPQASARFEFAAQRLIISIPQAAIDMPARGYVSPERWDDGITAAMLNYSLSGAKGWARQHTGTDASSQYINLRPGINLGPWRLRNYTTWTRDDAGQSQWDTVYTYAQRTIIPLKSLLTLGDSTAPADVFDSMPFRGGQLASDDDMLPDSLKGYAPVVRGIARTNAQVVIRQNGYQIYQSNVAPGAFEITDMYPTGGAGALDVTINEADGSVQHFTVPFASLPVLQREGQLKYAVTGGQYRSSDRRVDATPFGQLTGIYGLPFGLTLYGGLQQASKYHSLAAGMGKNIGDFGALSADVTQGWSTPCAMPKVNGQSWRVRYSKNFVATGTQFAIAGYRYSTRGYYGMQEVLDSWGNDNALSDRRRNRAELTMSQTLGNNLGSVMFSAVREDYWNAGKTTTSWNLGYNNFWHNVSYGLTYTWSENGSAGSNNSSGRYDKDRMLSFNVSVPLTSFLPQTWANYGVTTSKNSGTTHNLGVNGTALENNALSWNVQQGYGTNDVGYTGNINGDYKGTYGEATAGYSYDQHSKWLNYALQGGVVAHADGITFSQPLAETNVLLKVPGAAGIGVQNQSGVKTDYRGYTLVGTITPYRKNDIALSTETLPTNIELEQTVQTVIPTRGAIVRADYVANVGLRVLMTLTQQNGRPVPFGAMATVAGAGHSGFIVGDAGQVYLAGLQPDGKLTVKWGEGENQRCQTHYSLNIKQAGSDIIHAAAVCR
ncbi:fimbria/pilus outer membrane usher protein [Enterobacter cancerogenus]|uniref:fimbria/pilus outer membrane usher protein n=1 Tax=Enterobacter cancerogenus TaxID=69218 RepID=UPI003075FF22